MPRRSGTTEKSSTTAAATTEQEDQTSSQPTIASTNFKIRLVNLPFENTKLIFKLPGHTEDLTAVTFQIIDEDHTLGNALRYIIMKKYIHSNLPSIGFS